MKIDGKVIFEFVNGSHLYGTSTLTSDIDVRGVFIPSKANILGIGKAEKTVECKVTDTVYQPLRKFLALALECNPNIVEFLFVPFDFEPVIGIHNTITPEWEAIVNLRDAFISTKGRWTFAGYAVSQLKRLRKHRNWLLYGDNNTEPKREDYGLPPERKLVSSDQIGAFNIIVATRLEEIAQLHDFKDMLLEMQDTVDYTSIVQGIAAKADITEALITILPDIAVNFIQAVQMEKAYAQDKKEYDQYLNWKKTRNLARYELEKKFKYDCKFASHCYRLITEGEELLQTGYITFPRPDRELLSAIRNGCWTYDELMANIGDVDIRFNNLYTTSPLPKKPDTEKVDTLCIELLENWLKCN